MKEVRDRWRIAFGSILVVAFLLRVAYVLYMRDQPPLADGLAYQRIAEFLVRGEGFGPSERTVSGGPTAFRTPVYPTFVAAIFALTDQSVLAVRLAQAFIGTVVVGLIGLIAWLIRGPIVAAAALIVAALYPRFVISSVDLLTEPLFVLLELGCLACALAYRRSPHVALLLGSGVLTGVATLTRPVGIVLLAPLCLLVWKRDGKRSVAAPVVVAISAIALIAPWSIRNTVVFGEFVPLSTIDGFDLAGTYNETSRNDPKYPGQYRPYVADPKYRALDDDPSLNEAELSSILRDEAVTFAIQHPGYALEVAGRNSLRLFEIGERDLVYAEGRISTGLGSRTVFVRLIAWYILAMLAIVGAIVGWKRLGPWAFWITPVLFWAATVPIITLARFRVPMEPFVILLAAVAIVAAYERLFSSRLSGNDTTI